MGINKLPALLKRYSNCTSDTALIKTSETTLRSDTQRYSSENCETQAYLCVAALLPLLLNLSLTQRYSRCDRTVSFFLSSSFFNLLNISFQQIPVLSSFYKLVKIQVLHLTSKFHEEPPLRLGHNLRQLQVASNHPTVQLPSLLPEFDTQLDNFSSNILHEFC